MTTSRGIARRVSFSDRISYSDDASTSTGSTDDDLISLSSEEDESFDDDDVNESVKENVNEEHKQPGTKETSGGEEEGKEDARRSDASEGKGPDDLSAETEVLSSPVSWKSLVDDAPPLVFRDPGILERPKEYLGGYGPEVYASPPHLVKYRKSWVENEAEATEHNEFEEWKKSRAKQTKKSKVARSMKDTPKDCGSNFAAFRSFSMCSKNDEDTIEKEEEHENMDKSIELGKPKEEAFIPQTENENHANLSEIVDTQEPKECILESSKVHAKQTSALKKKKEKKHESEVKDKKKGSASASFVKPRKPKKDAEMEAYEKDILMLKEEVSKLQRKFDVIEVRHVSQLADLEEETTKRMREYREWADDLTRKQRAKEEKQALKQKAMKSQDVIEQLRRSNQKLRAEGIKMKDAVAKLKESNQLLEEKNSFQRNYAVQFQNCLETEVCLEEAMNQALMKDMPKYETLVRGMEDGVIDREKCGDVERHAKELYEGCINTLIEELEDKCSDLGLVDKIVNMADDRDEDKPSHGPEESLSSIKGDDQVDVADWKVKPKRSSSIRASRSSTVSDTYGKGNHVKSFRRSSSSGGRASLGGGRRGNSWLADSKRSTPRKSSSFRGTRSPRSVATSSKNAPDDDDSSTCSITSVNSDTISITGYSFRGY